MSSTHTCNSLAPRRLAARRAALGLSKLRRCGAGMTLIEVLTALALFALLAAALLLASRLADRTYRSVIRLDQGSWQVVTAQRFLRGVLESADPFEQAPANSSSSIDGTRGTLAVTGPMPMAVGSMGLYRYVFILQKRADGLDNLVVQTALDRGSASTRLTLADSAGLPPEILLTGIESARWSYLSPDTHSINDGSPPMWLNSWHGSMPPPLIRLRVKFPPKDYRVWPEFLVGPRITDDARCQFDSISQVCRRVTP